MPTICRLLQLSPDQATNLTAHLDTLAQAVEAAKIYSDVYRYWDAIQYLLARHRPASPAANWLGLGQAVSIAARDIPAARVLTLLDVEQLDATLQEIEPEDLADHYDAEAMDQAGVYPRRWQIWEETFDPLGQVLEHYWFLKEFVGNRRANGDALLLYFVHDDDGSDD